MIGKQKLRSPVCPLYKYTYRQRHEYKCKYNYEYKVLFCLDRKTQTEKKTSESQTVGPFEWQQCNKATVKQCNSEAMQ